MSKKGGMRVGAGRPTGGSELYGVKSSTRVPSGRLRAQFSTWLVRGSLYTRSKYRSNHRLYHDTMPLRYVHLCTTHEFSCVHHPCWEAHGYHCDIDCCALYVYFQDCIQWCNKAITNKLIKEVQAQNPTFESGDIHSKLCVLLLWKLNSNDLFIVIP